MLSASGADKSALPRQKGVTRKNIVAHVQCMSLLLEVLSQLVASNF